MALPKNLPSLIDPENLSEIDPSYIIFIKDRKGIYLSASTSYVKLIGMQNGNDIIGAHDLDLCWAKESIQSAQNDKIILQTKAPRTFVEYGLSEIGIMIKAISHKFPLFTKNKKISGVIGMARILNTLDDASSNNMLLAKLSIREQECVKLYLQGKTSKETAILLGISSRTVEEYFINIKKKFNCKYKRELNMIFNINPRY